METKLLMRTGANVSMRGVVTEKIWNAWLEFLDAMAGHAFTLKIVEQHVQDQPDLDLAKCASQMERSCEMMIESADDAIKILRGA